MNKIDRKKIIVKLKRELKREEEGLEMIPSENNIYKMGFDKGKKQGALKELNYWNGIIQASDILSDNNDKKFKENIINVLNNRIKELEGESKNTQNAQRFEVE